MDHKLLDYIVEVQAAVTEMRLLIEGAITLFDEAAPLLTSKQRYSQRLAAQHFDAIRLALDDLRDLVRGVQEEHMTLPESLNI